MKIYQPLQVKDAETGLWYKEWEIPEGMPVPEGMVLVAPSDNLLFPRWDNVQGVWIEDKDSIIEKMKTDNDALKLKIESIAQLNSKLMLNDVKLTAENTALKEKADNLAQINSKTMLASIQNSKDIEKIKSQLENNEGGK